MPEPTYLLMAVARVIPESVWDAVQVFQAFVPQPGLPATQRPHQSMLIEFGGGPGTAHRVLKKGTRKPICRLS